MEVIHVLPDTAISVLRLFETSQAGIDTFSDQLIEEVEQGKLNPLELRAICKSLEMIIDRVNKATQKNQLNAADLYPGDNFEAYGVKFVKADVYTAYDFAACGDPIWSQRAQIADSAKEQLKERETFLKTIKAPMTIIDDSTGEVVTINPPAKKSTAGLKLSIK